MATKQSKAKGATSNTTRITRRRTGTKAAKVAGRGGRRIKPRPSARERLGLSQGQRLTVDQIMALIRLGADYGFTINVAGEVRVLNVRGAGDHMAGAKDSEPVAVLSLGQRKVLFDRCAAIIGKDYIDSRMLWDQLRIDFADAPK